jgi:hypothetical protein
MDKAEAAAVLDQHVASFVRRGYAALVTAVDRPDGMQTEGPSGTKYNIEFNVFYDAGHGKGDLRIVGSIDDGGTRTFMFPLTKTEIMKPTGELV